MENKEELKLNHLDHVAIRVKNIDISSQWYSNVLGLKKVQTDKWGAYPIFMLAGKTGVAIFPHLNTYKPNNKSPYKHIDHFAFNVDNENFKKAKHKLDVLGIVYDFQDHFYFHSIYIKDPDDHTVELTTRIGNTGDFYNLSE